MLAILFLACSGSLPPELENPYKNPHAGCPAETHYSSRGIGEDQTTSISDAHRGVAEQIVSQIQSQTNMLSEYQELVVSKEGENKAESSSKEYFQAKIQTKSEFSHNELIKDIIPPQKYKKEYYTLSCLDKAETGTVLEEDLKPNLDQFYSLAEQAKSEFEEGDIAGFSTLYYKANELQKDIVPDLYIIRSVTGYPSRMDREFRSTWKELNDTATGIRSKMTIGLNLEAEDLPDSDRQALKDVFRSSFKAIGLKTLTAEACEEKISYYASLQVRPNCKYSETTKYFCKPIVDVRLHDCERDEEHEFDLSSKKFSGQDYYKEEEALKKAMRMIEKVNFQDELVTELQSVLPVDW